MKIVYENVQEATEQRRKIMHQKMETPTLGTGCGIQTKLQVPVVINRLKEEWKVLMPAMDTWSAEYTMS